MAATVGNLDDDLLGKLGIVSLEAGNNVGRRIVVTHRRINVCITIINFSHLFRDELQCVLAPDGRVKRLSKLAWLCIGCPSLFKRVETAGNFGVFTNGHKVCQDRLRGLQNDLFVRVVQELSEGGSGATAKRR